MSVTLGFVLWCLWMRVSVDAEELFSKKDAVHLLTAKDFDRTLRKNYTATAVLFYAPYCQQSKKLAPLFLNAAQSFQGIIRLGAVDCADSSNHDICRRYEIKSFPTIKLFGPAVVESEQILMEPQTYEGPLTAAGIAKSTLSLISGEHIRREAALSDLMGDVHEAQERRRLVVLFTDKKASTVLYKSLAWRYHQAAAFYEVPKSHEDLISRFQIQKFPTLRVFKGKDSVVDFSGQLAAQALIEFLDEALDVPKEETQMTINVHMLNATDLEKIDTDEEIWLVAFFADPEGTRCFEPLVEFDTVAKTVREIVRVGVFNLTAHPRYDDVEDMGLSKKHMLKHPCEMKIVRFPFGKGKNEKDEYEIFKGDLVSKSLQEFALEANEIRPVKLDSESMMTFMGMVEQTRLPSRPKAALAMSLRHWKADFGFVPLSETTLRQEFHVKAVPTLMMVYFDPTAEEGKQVFAPQYQGPLRFGAMKGWMEALMITLKADKKEHHDPFFVAEEKHEVARIQTEADLQSACNTSVPLCAIAILDTRHEKFQKHLEWLEMLVLRRTSESSPFEFAWVDGNDAQHFIHEFGVGIGDVPSMIIFSPKKQRYATLKRTTTDPKAVDAFLNGVMTGQEHTYHIQSLPPLVMTTAVEAQEMEEEIDLAELEDIEVGDEAADQKDEL